MTLRRLAAALGLTAVLLAGAAPAGAAPAAPGDSPSGASVGGPGDEEGTGSAADGGELVTFGIAPAGVERPDDRPYVSVTAAPGSVIYEHVAIINQADQPIDLDVYPGDVIMAEGGGLSVTTKAETPYDTGVWLGIEGPKRVTVPAQTPGKGYGYVVVPVTVSIPANATPGDHVAGVVASFTTTGKGGDNAPNVDLEQRVAARVYIHVTGQVTPRLAITETKVRRDPSDFLGVGSATVTYTLQNPGNVAVAVEPSVTIAGPFGLHPVSAQGDRVDLLLPGGSVAQTVTVRDVWPLIRENVRVDARAVAAPAGLDPGLGTVSATAHFWAIPWLVIGVLVALVAFVVWRDQVRRRRRRRRAAAPAGSRRAHRAGRRTPPAPVGAGAAVGAGTGGPGATG